LRLVQGLSRHRQIPAGLAEGLPSLPLSPYGELQAEPRPPDVGGARPI
jgi:hypothetical protein